MSDKPTVFIGKSGVTTEILSEIKGQLKANKQIKIKLLASARKAKDRRVLAQEIAKKTGAHLVEVRGNTFIISIDK